MTRSSANGSEAEEETSHRLIFKPNIGTACAHQIVKIAIVGAFKDAINRGISRIADYLPTRAKANPCWPGGVHPRARMEVKEEVKEEELPTDPRKGTEKIRLLDDPKPKVKVDKRAKAEARADQLKESLSRRKEMFPERVAAGRQSGEEDS